MTNGFYFSFQFGIVQRLELEFTPKPALPKSGLLFHRSSHHSIKNIFDSLMIMKIFCYEKEGSAIVACKCNAGAMR
jgi:hypothetical protein